MKLYIFRFYYTLGMTDDSFPATILKYYQDYWNMCERLESQYRKLEGEYLKKGWVGRVVQYYIYRRNPMNVSMQEYGSRLSQNVRSIELAKEILKQFTKTKSIIKKKTRSRKLLSNQDTGILAPLLYAKVMTNQAILLKTDTEINEFIVLCRQMFDSMTVQEVADNMFMYSFGCARVPYIELDMAESVQSCFDTLNFFKYVHDNALIDPKYHWCMGKTLRIPVKMNLTLSTGNTNSLLQDHQVCNKDGVFMEKELPIDKATVELFQRYMESETRPVDRHPLQSFAIEQIISNIEQQLSTHAVKQEVSELSTVTGVYVCTYCMTVQNDQDRICSYCHTERFLIENKV